MTAAVGGGFEHFGAAPDIGVASRGATLPEVFGQAALGMFALLASPDGVEERDVREVRAHADSLEGLLVSWLNECLYVHDVEGFVACRVEFAALDASPRAGGEPFRLHGFLHGEELDTSRHRRGVALRSARLPGASLVPLDAGFEGRVIFTV